MLGAPVLEVLNWSSRTDKSSVSAEFILMEEPRGVYQSEAWPTMTYKKRFELTKEPGEANEKMDVNSLRRKRVVGTTQRSLTRRHLNQW